MSLLTTVRATWKSRLLASLGVISFASAAWGQPATQITTIKITEDTFAQLAQISSVYQCNGAKVSTLIQNYSGKKSELISFYLNDMNMRETSSGYRLSEFISRSRNVHVIGVSCSGFKTVSISLKGDQADENQIYRSELIRIEAPVKR